MKLIYFLPLFSIAFLYTININSQTKNDIPTIEEDVCPFEGCQFGKWIIKDSIKVYEKEGDTSSVNFILCLRRIVARKTHNSRKFKIKGLDVCSLTRLAQF